MNDELLTLNLAFNIGVVTTIGLLNIGLLLVMSCSVHHK